MPRPSRQDLPIRVAYAFLDLNDGGAQRLTLAACCHLDPGRFHATVLCLRAAGSLVDTAVEQGLPVRALGRLRRPRDVGAVLDAARWLRGARIDVLHVSLYSRASPYARLAARLAGVPLTVAHEWSRPAPPGRARRYVDRALRPGTRFVAASSALRDELAASGVPLRDIELVHSGIEPEAFAPRDRAESRRRLGLEADRPILLAVGRLHPMKGHVDLIEAVARLRPRVPGLLVLVAGDGPLRSVLPALSTAAGTDEVVRFLGPRPDVPDLLGACDLLVHTSRIEGLPSVVLEAMCAERPVVATSVGGVPEAMPRGVGGWLVPARDSGAVAAAVVAALADPAAAARRAAGGRARVLAHFRADQAARRLEDAYTRFLGGVDRRGDGGAR